jgi:hypothetical protein
MGEPLTRRILLRLEQAEAREPNPHLQDDYRIAWITVLNASRGQREPHVSASYTVLGLHPEKVWPSMVARRRADTGADYDKFFPSTDAPSSPKKPVRSVRLPSWKKGDRDDAA